MKKNHETKLREKRPHRCGLSKDVAIPERQSGSLLQFEGLVDES